jgi:hypothetical protein
VAEGPADLFDFNLEAEADFVFEIPMLNLATHNRYLHLIFYQLLAPFAVSNLCSMTRQAGRAVKFEETHIGALEGKSHLLKPSFDAVEMVPQKGSQLELALKQGTFKPGMPVPIDAFQGTTLSYRLALKSCKLIKSRLSINHGHELTPMPNLRGGPIGLEVLPRDSKVAKAIEYVSTLNVGGEPPLPFFFTGTVRVTYACNTMPPDEFRLSIARMYVTGLAYPILIDELITSLRRAALPPIAVPGDFMTMALPNQSFGQPVGFGPWSSN